ncbi:hypothetical protein [Hyphococcus sp.]|uniref:hypothetical protein n=1 Tax=Hyphococcus sp. TaxID=2038636 RepID=UPI0035C750AB
MKRISLRAPLAAALSTAALFATCAASEINAVSTQEGVLQFTAVETDRASCRPYGPRFSERMQRYQRCLGQNRRLELAKKASFQQAQNQSK